MALSLKTKEHILRAAALLVPKWGALLGGGAALALSIGFTGSALHFTTVTDTHGGRVRILTAATDLATVLRQAETPPLGENDKAIWSQTDDGTRLDILRAYTVPVTADGTTQEIITTGATAAELLAQAGLTWTEDDILSCAPGEQVPEGEALTLQRVSYVDYTQNEVIPTELEEIPSSLFYRRPENTVTVQQGSDGLDTVSYRETWVDGAWTGTEETGRETQIGMVPTVQKIYGEQVPVSQFVGPEIVDGAPAEGVAEVYTGQRQGGQRPPPDLRHGRSQPRRHSLWLADVHHQR